jgi:hypothetical protein
LTVNKPITVSGTGVNGEGALFNSSYGLFDGSGDQVLNITLAGDTTFGAASGGGSRWDLANGSTLSGPFKVTINFPGGYGEWDTVAIATNVGDLELAQGTLGIKGLGAGMGNPANTLTVDSGCELDIWNSNFGSNSGYGKNIHFLANATFKVLTSPNTFVNASITSESGDFWQFVFGSGAQTMNGPITLNGVIQLQAGNAPVVFSNVVAGSGGFVSYVYGNNESLVFSASNTYSGPTVIGTNMTLALTGNGSISGSSLIFLGGNSPASTFLDVSGRPDKTLTLASSQILGGIGTINGSLVVSAGAILSPAGTNTTLEVTSGANTTGTILVTNALALNGTTVIKLNGSGVNDQIQAGAGITYGGSLNLVNISGAPLAAGNRFQIFNSTSYAGSFANLVPVEPGAGLVWDTSQLNIGVVNVVAATLQPAISSTLLLGGNLIFSGTNGAATGSYSVWTATNLATPFTNWITLLTNTFDATGSFSVTNPISFGSPQQFYRIQSP